ncbi:hypothetical protein P618_200806 [Holospora obtusa F1]|uniref:Phospholipid-binding lipoprotein MlaA n=1 Tax=Holospora obtusa F1 TaxID=1399147 RepID=W6TGL0_HOLOB|nr:MlaA family lipoprotein [Holospora obtusa]ETZ07035.1 hypothetical protein P618_200806 [Holospora obtusa F1]
MVIKINHVIFGFFLIFLTGCSRNEPHESVRMKQIKDPQKKIVKEKDVIWDPLEFWNRGVFVFNQGIEHIIWSPLLAVYRTLVPSIGQKALHNVLEHTKIPVSILSWGLQGEGDQAFVQLGRFMCNTIFGLGGLVDISSDIHLEENHQDINRLLKFYNVPAGCFMMIPFLGPTVSRDLCGKLFNAAIFSLASPSFLGIGVFGAENLNQRLIFKDSVDHVMEFSSDPYAVIRRAYYESRGEFPDNFEQDIQEDDEDDEN